MQQKPGALQASSITQYYRIALNRLNVKMVQRKCEIDLQYFDVYLTETRADPGVHCDFKNEMARARQKKKKN